MTRAGQSRTAVGSAAWLLLAGRSQGAERVAGAVTRNWRRWMYGIVCTCQRRVNGRAGAELLFVLYRLQERQRCNRKSLPEKTVGKLCGLGNACGVKATRQ